MEAVIQDVEKVMRNAKNNAEKMNKEADLAFNEAAAIRTTANERLQFTKEALDKSTEDVTTSFDEWLKINQTYQADQTIENWLANEEAKAKYVKIRTISMNDKKLYRQAKEHSDDVGYLTENAAENARLASCAFEAACISYTRITGLLFL